MKLNTVSIAHSPDADDYFLFWAIRHNLIDTKGYRFIFEELDTEELNQAALREEFDICAISLACYPELASKYYILPYGSSVGRNFGPVIIAKEQIELELLNRIKIGIPGRNTTSALLLKAIAPDALTKEIPIRPYQAVFSALDDNSVDAAILIHEGQINFDQTKYYKILDLGKWWFQNTKLPIPLGINVISRKFSKQNRKALSYLIRDSITYSFKNLDLLLPQLFEDTQLKINKLPSEEKLYQYLKMYAANEDALEIKADTDLAIQRLIGDKTAITYSV